jgi:hypothetical protein
MPRVIQGVDKEIKVFEDRCREEIGKMMKTVPRPTEKKMPQAHSEFSEKTRYKSKELNLMRQLKPWQKQC